MRMLSEPPSPDEKTKDQGNLGLTAFLRAGSLPEKKARTEQVQKGPEVDV